MTKHAEGTFTLTSWEQNTYSDRRAAGKLTRARIGQSLIGSLTGQSAAELPMCCRQDGAAHSPASSGSPASLAAGLAASRRRPPAATTASRPSPDGRSSPAAARVTCAA